MPFTPHSLLMANLLACTAITGLLGSSAANSPSVVGVYELIAVNGEELPALVWTSNEDGDLCEYRSSGGAVVLTDDGRSAAFSLERAICQNADGSRSSTLLPFYMFTGTYDVSANRILFQEEDEFSGDHAVVDGDHLTVTVVGILKFEGQTSTFTFRKMQSAATPSTPEH